MAKFKNLSFCGIFVLGKTKYLNMTVKNKIVKFCELLSKIIFDDKQSHQLFICTDSVLVLIRISSLQYSCKKKKCLLLMFFSQVLVSLFFTNSHFFCTIFILHKCNYKSLVWAVFKKKMIWMVSNIFSMSESPIDFIKYI